MKVTRASAAPLLQSSGVGKRIRWRSGVAAGVAEGLGSGDGLGDGEAVGEGDGVGRTHAVSVSRSHPAIHR